ncbi:hypothetical protein A462_18075 [Pseudomonas sp. Ag1]|jgi:hypothetical protein|uniref:hypothetical protein n=1 Tax=Pseudomonas sp. Ag1 TaxID=1197727 RepID=UPI000272C236|nr:hypothetical protein [Pseudomonas sp. Ag1]EJF70476.1 hypothetical protein A462_18075 [Pseudomonas sp. Ag1]
MLKGIDKLQRQLADAQKVLQSLEGDLCTVNFNPHDPVSIEGAIQQISNLIDERVGTYTSNPIISSLAEQMKERYREKIIERAAAARLLEEEK